MIMHTIKSLLIAASLLTAILATADGTFAVESFHLTGDTDAISTARAERVLTPFIGTDKTLADLNAAAGALTAELHRTGDVFRRVVVPQQTVTEGVVELRILSFTLGQLNIQGNEHFDDANVRRALPTLQPGTAPNAEALATDLLLANRHPARQTTAVLSPGQAPDTIDADIQVDDSRPLTGFGTLDNTGDSDTGETRFSLGVQHSNLFNRDHALTASYTTSPEYPEDVRQFGIHYRVPFYDWRTAIAVYYSQSEVDSGTVANFFEVRGEGRFAGVRAHYTLPQIRSYSHRLGLAVEDRFFENDVDFVNVPIGVDVRSRPVSLHYDATLDRPGWAADVALSALRNISSGADNDDAAYARARAGADSDWAAARYRANLDVRLPRSWMLRSRLTGQCASEPLISGEQYGVGGAASVRGFAERELTGDRGQHASIELWTPALPADVRLLAFGDGGRVEVENEQPGDVGDETVASAGLGVRWQWRENLSCAVDAAYVLNGTEDRNDGEMRGHFSIFFRF